MLSVDSGSWEPDSCPSGRAGRHALECQLCRGANITTEAEPSPAPDFQAQPCNTFPASLSSAGEQQEEGEEMAMSDSANKRTSHWQGPCLWCLQGTLPRHRGLHLSPKRKCSKGSLSLKHCRCSHKMPLTCPVRARERGQCDRAEFRQTGFLRMFSILISV